MPRLVREHIALMPGAGVCARAAASATLASAISTATIDAATRTSVLRFAVAYGLRSAAVAALESGSILYSGPLSQSQSQALSLYQAQSQPVLPDWLPEPDAVLDASLDGGDQYAPFREHDADGGPAKRARGGLGHPPDGENVGPETSLPFGLQHETAQKQTPVPAPVPVPVHALSELFAARSDALLRTATPPVHGGMWKRPSPGASQPPQPVPVPVPASLSSPLALTTHRATIATQLCRAAARGDAAECAALLAAGARVDGHCDEYGRATPLGLAVSSSHLGVVRVLLHHGASIWRKFNGMPIERVAAHRSASAMQPHDGQRAAGAGGEDAIAIAVLTRASRRSIADKHGRPPKRRAGRAPADAPGKSG